MAAATAHAEPYTAPAVPVDFAALRKVALPAAVVGVLAWAVLAVANIVIWPGPNGTRDLFLTYLIGFIFWLSVPMGSLALTGIAYLTSASWGLVFRRVFQASMATIPVMGLLFVPLLASFLFDTGSPYWWMWSVESLKEITTVDTAIKEMVHRQELWMNAPRAVVTAAVIFAAWWAFARFILKHAPAAEDRGDEAAKGKLVAVGGPAVIFWALSTTVFFTDWVMSPEVAWASTMFPVIAGMNQFLTTFCFAGFLIYSISKNNDTALSLLKNKFRIDIGTLTLAFSMVWAYASFSQYMLIWAGNMPEEIGYYKRRLNGGWEYLAYFLMAFHWLAPFLALLFRSNKTNPNAIRPIQIMLLIVCAADVIWWTLPSFPHEGFLHVPMAVAAIVGVGGVWGMFFIKNLQAKPLFPAKDTEFLDTWGNHH